MKIEVYDGICGSGKTTLISNMIKNTESSQKILFITPYLEECHRIAGTYPDDRYDDMPPLRDKKNRIRYDKSSKYADLTKEFQHPETDAINKTKQMSLISLIKGGKNITATHALFEYLSADAVKELKKRNYHFIVDEAVNLVNIYPLNQSTMRMYINLGFVKKKANGEFEWIDTPESMHEKFNSDRQVIKNNRLIEFSSGHFIWELPPKILKAFKRTSFFTYLYTGTHLRYYCEIHKLKPNIIHLDKDQNTNESVLKKYSEFIKIEQNQIYNQIGEKRTDLSVAWYKKTKNKKYKDTAQNNCAEIKYLYAKYFRDIKSKIKESMWTCFSEYKPKVQYSGYSENYVAFNAKAFNKFQERKNLAYLVNVFLNPNFKIYLATKGIDPKEDYYALSEMVQWIFRSRIRKGKFINIYIPSRRMRNLLTAWIAYEDIKFIVSSDKKYEDVEIRSLNIQDVNGEGRFHIEFVSNNPGSFDTGDLQNLILQYMPNS
jgi:hypothetical protein